MTVDNTKEQQQQQQQQQRQQQQDRREEAILLSRFHRVATARLEDLMRQSEESSEGGVNNLQLGDAEQRILYSLHRQGVVEGLVAGIVTFAVLRKGPVYIARAVYRRRSREAMTTPNRTGPPPPSADGYQFSIPTATANTTPTTTTATGVNNPFLQGTIRPDFPRSRNIIVRSIWFTMDVMLSVMMAASVSMAYTDLEDITHQIVTLPLVPGRSLTSDALCDVIVKELALIQRENSPAYQRFQRQQRVVLSQQKQPQSATTNQLLPNQQPSQSAVQYFQAIQEFAANCQRRAFVERSIRQQQGLDSSVPVEISTPISPTAPRWTREMEEEEDPDTRTGQFLEEEDPFVRDMDWTYDQVDNWTKDQPPPPR